MASRGRPKKAAAPIISSASEPASAFHENVRAFLENATRVPVSGIQGCSAWVLRLVDLTAEGVGQNRSTEGTPPSFSSSSSSSVLLHIYEERLVEGSNSICDQCRNMGKAKEGFAPCTISDASVGCRLGCSCLCMCICVKWKTLVRSRRAHALMHR